MYIADIIPLVRLPKNAPDTLAYFTSEEPPVGSFAEIKIQKRKTFGVIIAESPLADKKSAVRRQEFGLKKIDNIIPGGLLPRDYIKLYLWASKFFLAQKNLMFKAALPNYFSEPTKAAKTLLASLPAAESIAHKTPSEEGGQLVRTLEGTWHERTERYVAEIESALMQHPVSQILVLFPTATDIRAFLKKLPENLRREAETYGSLRTPRENADVWAAARQGRARLILGTRNAAFLPLPLLSLIIIDGEQSSYYKSWDSEPKFDARDIAEKISEVFSIPLILGSAMPRQETWHRAEEGMIARERLGAQNKTPVTVIDIKKERKENGEFLVISRLLEEKIREALAKKERIFFFLGRRGYSANIACRDCGYTALCRNCQAPLVIHLSKDVLAARVLMCHKCLRRESPPDICPECKSHKIQSFGIGSQKMEEELAKLFPEASVLRIDSDTSEDPEEIRELLEKASTCDIVIGTELALKPSVLSGFSLGVIASFNQLLQQPDFRQEERIFSIVRQMEEIAGKEIIIQTSTPGSGFLKEIASHDIEGFVKRDSVFRKAFFYPPFAELIKLTIKNPIRLVAEKNSLITKQLIEEGFTKAGVARESVYIIGPVPAFISKERNEFVYTILLKIKDQNNIIKETLLDILPPYVARDVNPKNVL